MQSEETMKKLADNFGTLVMVSKRHPSSMSRLKNLLIAEVYRRLLLVEKLQIWIQKRDAW